MLGAAEGCEKYGWSVSMNGLIWREAKMLHIHKLFFAIDKRKAVAVLCVLYITTVNKI